MNDWTAGYVADIGYTFGYYDELNPLRARLALLNKGFALPAMDQACELGFGQGVSINFHAAGGSAQWYGCDFNPSQAAFAIDLAKAGGREPLLTDDSFAEFCARNDLPAFDFIGLHGIWSWISDENRHVLVDFIGRKLRPGGLLYISYNTMPGWAAFAPLRSLMTEHAEVIGSEGRGILNRMGDAIEFADQLLALNPAFLQANPHVAERLRKLKGQNRHYLAHEYFNRDWHPMPFASMANWLAPAKMQYACSASYLDHVDVLHLTPEQQKFLNDIPDLMFRESVRDFIFNQQFRRDYWLRGARRIPLAEQTERLEAQRVVLHTPRDDVPLKVNGSLGELTMNADIYNPVLDYLSDYQPRTLGEIRDHLAGRRITLSQVLETILVLAGAGHVSPCQDEAGVERSRESSRRLNAELLHKARGSADLEYVVSPLTGGGFSLGRFDQLFLDAMRAGKTGTEALADHAWQCLLRNQQAIIKQGKTLTTAEENLAELKAIIGIFESKRLPILKALGVV